MVRLTSLVSLRPLVFVLATVFLFGLAGQAHAELLPARARINAVTGKAEMLIRGQTAWSPATVGATLGDNDEIRTGPGASAELVLPDSSNILVAENTRFVVTRLAADPGTQNRVSFFHLAVGKVRAVVAKPAIQLVRARGVNFAISSPSGVAATRGTGLVTTYNPGTNVMLVAVIDDEVVLIDLKAKTYQTIPVNTYGTVPGLTGLVPVSQLPPNVQATLNSPVNPDTANSPALQARGATSFNAVAAVVITALLQGATPAEQAALQASLLTLAGNDPALVALINQVTGGTQGTNFSTSSSTSRTSNDTIGANQTCASQPCTQ